MKECHIADTIIISLDFDGVIAFGEPAKIKHAKLMHNLDLTSNQITKDTYPLGPIKYRELMDQVGSRYIMDFQLAPKCKEVLNSLFVQGFRFVVVTSRFDFEFKACKDFCEFHKLPIKYFHNTNETPKEYLCNKLHGRAMIDDTLSKLKKLEKSPLLRFYFNAPWNSYIRTIDKRYINVKSWDEFYNWLIYMKTMHEAICFFNNIKNTAYNSAIIYKLWDENLNKCEEWYKDYIKEQKISKI